MNTKQRKHSKFSASGAERWFNCQGSVALSEGLPDKDSVWSIEGTRAHEVLEKILTALNPNVFGANNVWINYELPKQYPREMINYALSAATFIRSLEKKTLFSDLLVETRIHLDFIHPEMFGTFDAAIVDYFGTLHVFDYKYGAGHAVNPQKNLQMIFYALGLAYLHHWNFKKVRVWIIQPRIKGYDGPTFWEISLRSLREYISIFEAAIDRVELSPNRYVEGEWCWFCKAKNICPLKQEAKTEKAISLFRASPHKKGA